VYMFIYILDYGTFWGGGNVSNMSFLEKKNSGWSLTFLAQLMFPLVSSYLSRNYFCFTVCFINFINGFGAKQQERKLWAMRLQSPWLVSIDMCSSCLNREEGKLWGHQLQETVSTLECSQEKMDWACQWLQCTLMHREKLLQGEGDD